MHLDATKQDQKPLWDLVVIGGGPAGMMAAGRAAERGARVLLIEKNDSLGKKLLITGGGRCNVTNAELDTRKLLAKFKDSDKYLFSAFSQWSVQETLDFFHGRNMPTKIEALQRVFPASNTAQSVWDVLVEYLQQGKVTVLSNTPVLGFETEAGRISGVKIAGKNGPEIVRSKEFVLATGGKSRPETGSTGDGFNWLKDLGHTIIEPSASLVPIAVKNSSTWVKRLQGITLQEAKISLFQNGVKQQTNNGRLLFTHFGLSGPTILNMSRDVSELLKYGEVTISIDTLPQFDYGQLNTKLQEMLDANGKKKLKNTLDELVPAALSPIVLELASIDPDIWCNKVSREQRLALVQLLKALPAEVEGLLGVDKAIVTSGGVLLDEVDFKTMRSRRFPNLFLIGDILNVDRPSGGYSLQLCWTTGFVAGNSTQIN
ncbi:MAG: NAD(P)/FAD-dependent oxidoreductase [bacterium]